MQRVLGVLVIFLLAACASDANLVQRRQQSAPQANASAASLTFIRASSSWSGGKIIAALYEIRDGTPQFIGVLPNDSKMAITVTPGKHRYMVYCDEAADFLEADVEANKAYYTMVTPRAGSFTFRFSFRPIRTTSVGEFSYAHPRFMRWVNDTQSIEPASAAADWAKKEHKNVQKNMNTYWPQWQNKPAAERAEQSITAADFAPNFQ